jgi:hypothetical protein
MPTISEVKYTKQFNYRGIDEWIGVTVQVQPGEDAKAALHTAKSLTEEFYSEISPQHNGSVVIQKEKPKSGAESLVQDINSCKELKVLETYDLITKNNPELREVYQKKFLELSN